MSSEPEPVDGEVENERNFPVAVNDTKQNPAEAKALAVANLTISCYQRASQLPMTAEERAALLAPFADECFKLGAGGNASLIYLEHPYLRNRLNEVFGPGQWAPIPRSRWGEHFTAKKGTPGIRVYVEVMLVIRGCFVGESIGSMEYYPDNGATDYADAVEGVKTEGLRRCIKELGVGLQAWEKDFAKEWLKRKRAKRGEAAPQGDVKPAAGEEAGSTAEVERTPGPAAGEQPQGPDMSLQEALAVEQAREHRPSASDEYAAVCQELVNVRNEFFAVSNLPDVPQNKEQRKTVWASILQKRKAKVTSDLTLPQMKELVESLTKKVASLSAQKNAGGPTAGVQAGKEDSPGAVSKS